MHAWSVLEDSLFDTPTVQQRREDVTEEGILTKILSANHGDDICHEAHLQITSLLKVKASD